MKLFVCDPKKILVWSMLASIGLCGAIRSTTAFAESNDIYQCTDENGKVEFKNMGNTKGCKKMVVDPVVVPKMTGAKPTSSTNAAPNFPKVDGATQKTRDNDSKRILEEELKVQESKLADLKRTYNNGEPERQGDERNFQKYQERTQKLKEDIGRTESDVQSIKSEIDKF